MNLFFHCKKKEEKNDFWLLSKPLKQPQSETEGKSE